MRTLLTALFCASLFMAGCGDKAGETAAEKTIEVASGGKVDIQENGEKVTIKTADGEVTTMSGGSAEKPEDFPKDVYCCKGPIKGTVKVPNGWMLTIESSGSSDSIVADARKFMSEKGWKEAMYMKQEKGAMIGFSKDEGKRSCTVTIGVDDGKSTVMITAANK